MIIRVVAGKGRKDRDSSSPPFSPLLSAACERIRIGIAPSAAMQSSPRRSLAMLRDKSLLRPHTLGSCDCAGDCDLDIARPIRITTAEGAGRAARL